MLSTVDEMRLGQMIYSQDKLSIIKKIGIGLSSLRNHFWVLLPVEYSKYRVKYYNTKGFQIHHTASIASNVIIKGKFKMGSNSSLAQNCTIGGENAGVFIGDNVMIAPNVVIIAFNHGYESIDLPMVEQKNIEAPVIIENDVWISANCTIGKGVTIGKGSIIASNSFVNKNVPPYSIVGGVPAKVIKSRTIQ